MSKELGIGMEIWTRLNRWQCKLTAEEAKEFWDDIEAIAALRSEPVAWMPIDTAPKNGNYMLLCVAGFVPAIGFWDAKTSDWIPHVEDGIPEEHEQGGYLPTHWMPLPAEPSRGRQDQGGEMSDTPKSDYHEIHTIIGEDDIPHRCKGRFVPISLSRELERENARLREELGSANYSAQVLAESLRTTQMQVQQLGEELSLANGTLESRDRNIATMQEELRDVRIRHETDKDKLSGAVNLVNQLKEELAEAKREIEQRGELANRHAKAYADARACALANEKDAGRLSFIEQKRATVYASYIDGQVSHWVFVDETKKDRRGIVKDTLRAAIDAAIAGSAT